MNKKQKKTSQERASETFFPVDKDDLKTTIEKQEKQEIPNTKLSIEKQYKGIAENPIEIMKKSRVIKPRRASVKKTKKTPNRKISFQKKVEYSAPKVSLKEKGYELIITEKPQAALKISSALGSSTKRDYKGIPYYEVERNKNKIVVACAVGHLFTLTQNTSGSSVPVFDIKWVPNYFVKKNDFTKKYYDTLLNLVKNAGSVTIATDYDVEGEVIGLNVLRFICAQKDANRMKFSTLTTQELNKSYDDKSPNINWGQAIAGETRHFLDWFYGINLSRALMNAIKTTGRFRIISIGRVQGPALNLIVQKEREILKFKSEPYWQVFISFEDPELELKYEENIFDKSKLKKFENLKGKKAILKTEKTQNISPPNPPFNLTTLQTEAYKFHGITPSNTMRAAQSLYLAGLISYPRTSSQKLPDSIDYKKILETLKEKYKCSRLITRNKPIEGKKTDPAHPSIYPTGNYQILSGDEEKIYSLIVKRFLSLFCDDAVIENKKITATTNNLVFLARGSEIKKKAWMEIYPSKLKEIEIPDVNGERTIKDSRIEEKETEPPKRYSPASIISQLEKKNLGTKATRSTILETLYNRGYIQDESVKATPLGMSLITTLEKYSPIIIDENLTKTFENGMEKIVEAKKGYLKMGEKLIDSAKETIIKISGQFEKNQEKIGQELLDANIKQLEKLREENKLNQCPVCKKGNLAVMYSKKTKRYFVACDKYPECKTTYSLPPNGKIKKTEKVCEECGFPMLIRLSKGKRPWTFCFNPNCKTNKERVEKYKKEQEEESSKI